MVAPFVQVSINDQTIYSEPSPRTIPLFVVSTRANKTTPDGSGIAPGTQESDVLRLVSSQRELIQNYGNPVFVTSEGDPVPGDETNEYQLMAAHSVLGITNRAYILRAPIDLGALIPTNIEPVLPAPNGTYWIDKDAVVGGIFKYNGATWDAVNFTVYTTVPTGSDGVDGDWAFDYSTTNGTMKFKNGGIWYTASSANLTTQLAGAILTSSIVVPVGPTTGDFWYKTTSGAGGTDLKLAKFRAVDGVWVAQVIIRATIPPVPNEGVIWEDLTNIPTNGNRPLYVGTGTSFILLTVVVQDDQPSTAPDTGTLWYDDDLTDFALYVEGTDLARGNQWVPILTTTVSNPTAEEKVISGSAPAFPNEGAIWVDVSSPGNIDNYPIIKKWVSGQWIDITASVLIQSTDPGASTVVNGTYWLNNGEVKTRNTVKSYDPDYNAVTVVYNSGGDIYEVVTEVGNNWKPSAGDTFGRKSQRELVVESLQGTFVANQDIRAEAIYFQLIACPGYPELYDEMVALNTDIKEVAFVVVDTPKFMIPSGIPQGREVTPSEWYTNANNVISTGERGYASASSPYSALYYPWCIATDLSGNNVMQPPSHMSLRTIAFSDSVSAPWLPPAGFTRGRVDNASAVGYLNNDGAFQPVILNRSQNDALTENKINPITSPPNRPGLIALTQLTNTSVATALDRMNVSRLIVKMKWDLQRLLEGFLQELNTPTTRRSAQIRTERYLSGLKSLQALFDFAVRCDESNNTSDVISRNELFVDVAIKPFKAIDFIFVPINILDVGDDFPF